MCGCLDYTLRDCDKKEGDDDDDDIEWLQYGAWLGDPQSIQILLRTENKKWLMGGHDKNLCKRMRKRVHQ